MNLEILCMIGFIISLYGMLNSKPITHHFNVICIAFGSFLSAFYFISVGKYIYPIADVVLLLMLSILIYMEKTK